MQIKVFFYFVLMSGWWWHIVVVMGVLRSNQNLHKQTYHTPTFLSVCLFFYILTAVLFFVLIRFTSYNCYIGIFKPYVAGFSGFFSFYCPFGILSRLFLIHQQIIPTLKAWNLYKRQTCLVHIRHLLCWSKMILVCRA